MIILKIVGCFLGYKEPGKKNTIKVTTMNKIIGRAHEQKILQSSLLSDKAEFIAIYGRRRIGKTFLVRNFCKKKGIFFEVLSIPKEKERSNISIN